MSKIDEAFGTGKFLATVNANEYRLVSIVFERTAEGVIQFFCKAEDWPDTPIALLAKRDAEIAKLKARIAELETPIKSDSHRPFRQDTCPLCGYEGVEKGVRLHMIRKHGTTPKEYARQQNLDA